jgi:hypothetical protein
MRASFFEVNKTNLVQNHSKVIAHGVFGDVLCRGFAKTSPFYLSTALNSFDPLKQRIACFPSFPGNFI